MGWGGPCHRAERRALKLLQAMRARGIPITQFLDRDDIEAIHRAAGVPLDADEEDGVEEEIDEDM